MKKFILLLTLVCFTGCFIACGKDDNTDTITNDDQTVTEDNGAADTTDEDDNNSGSYDEITEDVVRNHAVTDASEFEYSAETDENGVNGIKITKYIGTDTIVVIPNEIDGKPVTSIGMAFVNDSPVQGVFIPNNVKRLSRTFGNNQCIEVVIFEGIEIIGSGTFVNCPKLHTLILGECLKEIDISAFGSLSSLKELYIPKSAETIPPYALTGISSDLIFKGEAGSYIETYCTEYELKFEAVD